MEIGIVATVKNPFRFAFLDGVRGLAAGYVLLHHIYMNIMWQNNAGQLSAGVQRMTGWLADGIIAVQIFIVLSGFCLMIPVIGDDGRLRGGLAGFFLRRTRRILPCYYGALIFSLILIAVVPGLSRQSGISFDTAVPVTTPGFLTHLFLVHNFSPRCFTQIDPPMWSIAIEWQIYFVFALVLLPVWRRLGTLASVLTGVLIGYCIHWFTLGIADYSQPSYIGFFAIGMGAASLSLGTAKWATFARRLPWGVIGTAVLGVVCLFFGLARSRLGEGHFWMIFTHFLAFSVAALLISQMTAVPGGWNLRRLMELRPVQHLGLISYSLYLTHFPVLAAVYSWVRQLPLSPDAKLGVMMVLGIPLSLGVACLFYRFLERPFLSSVTTAKALPKKEDMMEASFATSQGTQG